MSNFLTVESRKKDVIIMFLNLCTLYCRINSLLLMLVVRKLSEKEKNWCSRNVFFDVAFSRSISKFVDVTSLFDFSDRWCRSLYADCRRKIKKQMIECFRRERVVEKWSYYLINDEIVRINVFDLLTSFTTCAFEKVLQNDRELKKKILVEERWNDVDERQRQKCVENFENDCCCWCWMIIRQRHILKQSLMRYVRLDLESWDESEEKSIHKIVNDFELRDDVRFKRILIRNVEIFKIENIDKRIDAIWLKWNVFVYKQRVILFDMCRLEIQRNQKFNRFFVNFRSFDSSCLDSNNLSSLRKFNDSFVRNALKIRECEIFAWEHDDHLALEFRDWWNKLRDCVKENNYLSTLFSHLRHYCLSIQLRWRNHEKDHRILCENESNSEDESNSENDDDDENHSEKAHNWFWCWSWCWFWWCWF